MNKEISLKKKINQNQLTIGSWITLAHQAIVEILASSGFDWLVVDMEHSVISLKEAEEAIRICNLKNIPCLVRVSGHDKIQVKRLLDSGADGIIAPNINNIDDVNNFLSWMNYPPKGSRGVGLARAQGYGESFNSYLSKKSKNLVFIPQIEHFESVDNIESILNVDGVDGYIIGPYDLSSSLGIHGDFEHKIFKESIEKIKAAGLKFNKPGGLHIIEPNVNELQMRINEGYKFLAYSLDIRILSSVKDQLLKIDKKN